MPSLSNLETIVLAGVDGVRVEAGQVTMTFEPEMAKRLATNLLEAAYSCERMREALQRTAEVKP